MPDTTPFGRVLSAMVTPMRPDGSIDFDEAGALAAHLVEQGHDGIVVSGTTGESATTTDAEKVELIRAVVAATSDRIPVTAGVGTNDTRHTVELAKQAQAAGARALLVVTPYYNRPPQSGLIAHFEAAADATDLPVMLYDIPARSATAIATETLIRLAEHRNIAAVKDAKGDLWASSQVLAATDLLWYSGDDAALLPHLAQGATGIVGVTSQVAPRAYAAMVAAATAGDFAGARKVHVDLIPLVNAVMGITQGVIMAKEALVQQGRIGANAVRLPLLPATEEQQQAMATALAGAGEL